MVIMALDHVRDYFIFGSFTSNPTDLSTTTPILFFTRIITHYCAPVFVLLTGTSAYLYGYKKNRQKFEVDHDKETVENMQQKLFQLQQNHQRIMSAGRGRESNAAA